MYNVSFDNKIGLYEKHDRDERTAYVMFLTKNHAYQYELGYWAQLKLVSP